MSHKGTANTSATSATDAIQSIGRVFVARFFKTIQGEPGAWALDRFYDQQSRHVQLRAGGGERPEEAFGLDRIGRSVARMRFDRFDAFAVDSVFTVETRPTRYTVVAVGRAGCKRFVHSTVMVNMPSTKTRQEHYKIVRTTMKFIDRVVGDEFFNTTVTEKPAATSRSPRGKATTVKRTAIAESLPSGCSVAKLSAPTTTKQKIEPVAPTKNESALSLQSKLNRLKSFEDNSEHTRNIIKNVNECLIKLLDEKKLSNGDGSKIILPAKQDGRLEDLGSGSNHKKSKPRPVVQKPMTHPCPATEKKKKKEKKKSTPPMDTTKDG